LPLRFADMGRLHRNERSGTLTGLMRVRQFTQDDAHIYCRLDQIQDEITALLELVREWYKTFMLEPFFKLSTRPEKSLGTDEQWQAAEGALQDALRANGLAFELNPGDGTFYGPKIDVDVQDALGRRWQVATIQVDFQQPDRFGLEYIDSDAQVRKVPYMLVVGAREADNGTVSLRHRSGDDLGAVPLDRVLADLAREIGARDTSLVVGRS